MEGYKERGVPENFKSKVTMPALDYSPLHFYSGKRSVFTILKLLFQSKSFYYSQPNVIITKTGMVMVMFVVGTF